MARMSDTVCCPICWRWSPLGTAIACKVCGTPLIFADGRLVGPETGDGDGDQGEGEAVAAAPPAPSPRGWSRLRAVLHRSTASPQV